MTEVGRGENRRKTHKFSGYMARMDRCSLRGVTDQKESEDEERKGKGRFRRVVMCGYRKEQMVEVVSP